MASTTETNHRLAELTAAIERHVRANFVGRKIDGPAFFDTLLDLAVRASTLSGDLAGVDQLRIFADDEGIVVPVDGAKWKLRNLCARFAVLCGVGPGREHTIFGGDGEFSHPADPDVRWHAVWHNTPDRQDFTLTRIRGS